MQHTLFVNVLCATRLIAADFGAKPSSDPYVKITHGNNHFKTSVIKKCLSPIWNQSFIIPVTSFQDPLIFQVFDKDTIGSDDSLGGVQFFLHGINENQELVKVFKLYGGEHGSNIKAVLGKHSKSAKKSATTNIASTTATNITKNEKAGKLVGKFMNKAQKFGSDSNAKHDAEEKQNIQFGHDSTRPGILGRVDSNNGILMVMICMLPQLQLAQNYKPTIPPAVGQLTVRLISGRNLIAADFGSRPSSDPYCTLSIGNQKFTSNIVKKTLNPDWNQLFGFQNIQQGDKLILSIWDRDSKGHDDSLGDGVITLSNNLIIGQEIFFLVKLVGGDSGENFQGVINDHVQPAGQNIAAVTAENAIGGQLGKITGHVIQKLPKDEENKNIGTIAVSLTLSNPLGSQNPAQIQRCMPTNSPITEVEVSARDNIGLPPN